MLETSSDSIHPSLCTWSVTPSFPGWVLIQKAGELGQSPFHYPEVFQVNNPKSHEKTNFGLLLQGADILKSKHSGQAEMEPFNVLKSFLKVRRHAQAESLKN